MRAAAHRSRGRRYTCDVFMYEHPVPVEKATTMRLGEPTEKAELCWNSRCVHALGGREQWKPILGIVNGRFPRPLSAPAIPAAFRRAEQSRATRASPYRRSVRPCELIDLGVCHIYVCQSALPYSKRVCSALGFNALAAVSAWRRSCSCAHPVAARVARPVSSHAATPTADRGYACILVEDMAGKKFKQW